MKKFIDYLKAVKKELKQVKWLTKEQTIKYTKQVIIISVFSSISLGLLDLLFNYLLSKVL